MSTSTSTHAASNVRPRLMRGKTMPAVFTTASTTNGSDQAMALPLPPTGSTASNGVPVPPNSKQLHLSIANPPLTLDNTRSQRQLGSSNATSTQSPHSMPMPQGFHSVPGSPLSEESSLSSPGALTIPANSLHVARTSAPRASSFSPFIIKCSGGSRRPSVEFSLDPSGSQHILLARLGGGFSNECLTVAARKGNVLWIVADRWDCEVDSKYEWYIQFDQAADLTRVHANFDHGLLKITVRRR